MKYYTVVKNKLQLYSTTQMNLSNIKLKQNQKAFTYNQHFIKPQNKLNICMCMYTCNVHIHIYDILDNTIFKKTREIQNLAQLVISDGERQCSCLMVRQKLGIRKHVGA